jgi:aspartyl-tRNA(Asn)/glutamyl-tRNA(Gln) amidotransferase subunit B
VYTRAIEESTSASFVATAYLEQEALSNESDLAPIVDRVLEANPKQVETYRGGKEGVLGFLVGQVMKETQGKADPKTVNRLLREKLRG